MVKAIEASKGKRSCRPGRSSEEGITGSSENRSSTRAGSARLRSSRPIRYQHATAGKPTSPSTWRSWIGNGGWARRPTSHSGRSASTSGANSQDFGGGCLTDLMTHWIDVVHWYTGRGGAGVGRGHRPQLQHQALEAPDTVNAAIEFPRDFMTAYLGTYVSRVDDGGLEFRGDRGTLKIDRVDNRVLSRRCRIRAGNADTGAGYLRPLERRRHADPPAELARLHPEPQTAERAHPRGASGGANRSSRQRGAASGSPGTLERTGREDRDLSGERGQIPRWGSQPHRLPTVSLSDTVSA